jgi:hypothetical protein
MDPITAFAMAQAAIAGVRKCVDLYKEAKAVAADVTEITVEVGTHIGKFFEAQEHVVTAAKEAKEKPAKNKSVNSIAFENVIRIRQLQQAEKELREFLIYQTPGLGSIWTDFERERARLNNEREIQEALDKKNFKANRDKLLRERERIIYICSLWASGIIVAIVITVLMYGIHLNYQEKKKLNFQNSEFHRKYESDEKAIECWKEYKLTGFLPRYCIAIEREKGWNKSNN